MLVFDEYNLKTALAVYFVSFFSTCMKNKKYIDMFFGSIFHLECKKYYSTFMINIESSLIHSMNIFICVQANIY